VTGIDTLYSGYFDFSRPHTVLDDSLDLVDTYSDPGGRTFVAQLYRIKDMGDKVDFNSITAAPESGYVAGCPAVVGEVYCLKTLEGYYIKFGVIGMINTGYFIIEWVMQNDGTRNLSDVGLNRRYRSLSWGTIKSYYK
jgi:hypothetical protein